MRTVVVHQYFMVYVYIYARMHARARLHRIELTVFACLFTCMQALATLRMYVHNICIHMYAHVICLFMHAMHAKRHIMHV